MAESAPHIYTSALSFAPKSSKTAQLYAPKFRNLIDLDVGRLDKWPTKQTVINCNSDRVTFIAFSPDGRQLVLCSDRSHFYGVSDKWNKTVRVLDVATGRFTAGPFRHTERVLSAVYSTDGKNILSASADGTIRIWNTECGVVDEPVEHITIAIDQGAECAAFSHNHKYIASSSTCYTSDRLSGNQTSYISVRDVETGSIVSGPFMAHKRRTNCLAFSPDDKSIASGSWDGSICVWSTQTGGLVAGPFEGHEGEVGCISYSHKGTFIVSGSHDCTVRLWEVGRTPAQIRVYKGHASWVKSVAFSSDDRWVVSGSVGDTVRVWDVETGDVVVRRLEGYDSRACSVAISLDGKRIASCSGGIVCIWDADAYWELGLCTARLGLALRALAWLLGALA